MSVKIYGYSDDLIEVEGDIKAEFGAWDDGINYMIFSNGTVLSIEYTSEGVWRLNRIYKGEGKYIKIEALRKKVGHITLFIRD